MLSKNDKTVTLTGLVLCFIKDYKSLHEWNRLRFSRKEQLFDSRFSWRYDMWETICCDVGTVMYVQFIYAYVCTCVCIKLAIAYVIIMYHALYTILEDKYDCYQCKLTVWTSNFSNDPISSSLASTWRHPRDEWAQVFPVFHVLPLLCIILNANRRTKTGEAWERG